MRGNLLVEPVRIPAIEEDHLDHCVSVSQFFAHTANVPQPRAGKVGADGCVCVYYSQLAAATQIDGTLNDESDEDTGFVTEIAIPFGSFVDTAPNVPPKPGDTWRLNLYRVGGRMNAQYSQWSNTGTPQPKYHVPERVDALLRRFGRYEEGRRRRQTSRSAGSPRQKRLGSLISCLALATRPGR